ncbi:Crp/Fnr family transcriptional regulator [Sphingobacterium faecale]|uniref:Cyclic nucleotide-binding domain-containing protein n=1 Tax=Sphingobacterium faecale TaxID=2803775 RepID=A0ABS1R8B6_9SPHI|nr:cyclic nucleotide-binding domain-containing protein [Sphingobacterium faecale]MBL1410804.1 cyclic nucleotide-binding domain-containing protein [Sphingobacterium faecale]
METTQKEAIRILTSHLGKFGTVLPQHEDWIEQHTTYKIYPRNTYIYKEGSTAEQVFYICSGMLARVRYEEDPKTKNIKRQIYAIGLPQMGMLSTEHLYTKSPNVGHIITLRPSLVVSIPYAKLKALKENDPIFNTLMAALANKKKRQLSKLRRIAMIKDPASIYMEFTTLFPDLNQLLLQEEKQDLLQISRSTICRTNRFMLTGRNQRKDCVPRGRRRGNKKQRPLK